MTALALILLPLGGAVLAAAWPRDRTRPLLLPVVASGHTALSLTLFACPPAVPAGAWIGFDPLARALLPAVSLLFLSCSFYAVAYLRVRASRPNRVFVALLLAVLGLLSAGHLARHLGLLWIATEAVTLAAVPLIHFAGTARGYEATWKYLLVGGTGVALSLLGSFCLGYASLHGGGSGDLTFAALSAQGAGFNRAWLLTAWVLILAGYGTKMGLAPMHTWKPDAYGEAPGLVGALLAGGVTTVAFTALLRVRGVLESAGEGVTADRTLLALGLFSMAVAAIFLLGTRDFKRMLAYSSVEHMGILGVGAALGPAGVGAALFHVWGNSLAKGALFLSAGNIRRAAGTASIDAARGLAVLVPRSAAIFVAGVLAVTACPPFAPFFSELRLVRVAFANGQGTAAAVFLACLLLAFLGLSRVAFAILGGRPRPATRLAARPFVESIGLIAPPAALLVLALTLGLVQPEMLLAAWAEAAAFLFPPS